MFSLTQKVALVTGASRGLGAGIARALAQAGADVVVNYRSSSDRAGEVVDQIQALGRRALAVQADVSQESDVHHLFMELQKEFGRLDILVNNAGTTLPEDIFEISLKHWHQIIDTNLTSTFLCSKYAMEIMRFQESGRIINISSIVGQRGALFGHAHYAATKSGQLGLTKTVARTAAPYGVTVNAIAPGLINTELLLQTHGSEEIRELSAAIPLGLGTVEDIGYAAVYLASDEARFVTGATIDVNGGAYLR
ncbi:MAG: 3-oxoacyl-ACP reductase family protein [Chloroflexota bacterium]|nr:3-oxoacyl-ACP reductase family protein [Chloroflexota bacterium]